jgi:hypothetical protein
MKEAVPRGTDGPDPSVWMSESELKMKIPMTVLKAFTCDRIDVVNNWRR